MGTAQDFFEKFVTRQRLARAIPIILTLTIMWYLAKCFARSFFKSKPKARPTVTPQIGNNNLNTTNVQQIPQGNDNLSISNTTINNNTTTNLISSQNQQQSQPSQQQQNQQQQQSTTPRRNIPSCLNNTVIIQAMEKFNTTNQQPPVQQQQQQQYDEEQQNITQPLRKYKIHHFHHPLKNRTAALDLEALANDNTNTRPRVADPIAATQRQFLPDLQQENYYKNLLINNHHTKVVKQVLGDTQSTPENTTTTAAIAAMSDINTRNQMTLLNNIIQSHPGKMLDNQHLSGVLAGNHLLFTKNPDGSIDYTTLNPYVAQYIQYLLYNNVKLYLIITCTSQKDELAAYQTLRQAKIVKTSSKSNRLALPAHHVLFCANNQQYHH
eukprot:UN00062